MNTEMKNLMERIAGQCGGLPLVIVLVGGLLAENMTLDGWNKVRQDLNKFFTEGNDLNDGVWDVLALSYQDMPYHLKGCFLYLSLFPEDHDIRAESLVEMWIAEGFVSKPAREGGPETSLDVGLSYLNNLVNRCMVQANISKFTGRIRSIRLHDLMGRFCRSMAQEENFSQDISIQKSIPSLEKKKQSTTSTFGSPPNKICRLAVYFERCRRHEEITFPEKQLQHVRSCLAHNREVDSVESMDAINSLLKGFKFLKVFHLDRGVVTEEDIGKCIHLTYLSLQGSYVVPSLGNLVFLQTLILKNSSCRIPNDLWKLKELRHLILPGDWFVPIPGLRLDGLSKLETLINFRTGCCDVADLDTLPNLRKLRIWCRVWELGKIFQAPMFSESNSLLRSSDFVISGNVDTQEVHSHLCQVLASHRVLQFSLSGRVYEETSFLQSLNANITAITLKECGLKEDPMPSLGKIPNLRKLTLDDNSYMGKKMSMVSGSFPKLSFLTFCCPPLL